jgi:thiosulfate/3-mercaptopyruvate sulfurtransferase
LGVGTGRQVVAYDDAGGANAARCWWMLRYMGHAAAAVLDGGWQAWLAMGGTVERSRSAPAGGVEFAGEPHARGVVSCAEVPAVRQLVDARDPARYRGDHEPFDPVAGHIPGAINHYWQWNLDADGRFHSAADLAGRWLASLGAAPSADTVHYCGSGVTACHNVLSQVLAGFPMPRVYVGSWSEWCSDPSRAIATG